MIPFPKLGLSATALKLLIGIGGALLLALLVQDRNHWKAKTAHYAGLLASERTAHAGTVANYRAATERARLADAVNAARVRGEQATINERTKDAFEARITAARAAAGRLQRRPEGAAADPGCGGTAPMSGLPAAPGSLAQAAGEDRLSSTDALIATEQAIQLEALIEWVRQQAAVEPSQD